MEQRERDLSKRITVLRAGGVEGSYRMWRNSHRLNRKRLALIEKAYRRGLKIGWR